MLGLPPELVLFILSSLPIPALAALSATSKAWRAFFTAYESTIYRQAALFHAFVQPGCLSLDEVRAKTMNRLAFSSWKHLCRQRFLVDRSWQGKRPSSLRALPLISTPPDYSAHKVHRIKLDEKNGLVMYTQQSGGLYCMDMESAALLWMLSAEHVRPYAHLEYDRGYLLFDRQNGDKEVWRLYNPGETNPHDTLQEASKPDREQTSANTEAFLNAVRIQSHPSVLRGVFVPYAVLHMPEATRAYRFVYPQLLVAGIDRCFFWNVPEGRIVEVIEGVQESQLPEITATSNDLEEESTAGAIEGPIEDEDPSVNEHMVFSTTLGSLRYVDHSSTHLFLAGRRLMKVYSRIPLSESPTSSGSSDDLPPPSPARLALVLSTAGVSYGRWNYAIRPGTGAQSAGSALVGHEVEVLQRSWAYARQRGDLRRPYDAFVAVHVSPCGNHLAGLLLLGGRLIVVPHFRQFENLPNQARRLFEGTLDIQLGSPRHSMGDYLAYEAGDGGASRIGVVTTQGVFVITIPPFPDPPSALVNPSKDNPAPIPRYYTHPPTVTISHVRHLMNSNWLCSVSCLMMSDTGLFINYDPTTRVEPPTPPAASGTTEGKGPGKNRVSYVGPSSSRGEGSSSGVQTNQTATTVTVEDEQEAGEDDLDDAAVTDGDNWQMGLAVVETEADEDDEEGWGSEDDQDHEQDQDQDQDAGTIGPPVPVVATGQGTTPETVQAVVQWANFFAQNQRDAYERISRPIEVPPDMQQARWERGFEEGMRAWMVDGHTQGTRRRGYWSSLQDSVIFDLTHGVCS